jgi:hypothetical protein
MKPLSRNVNDYYAKEPFYRPFPNRLPSTDDQSAHLARIRE